MGLVFWLDGLPLGLRLLLLIPVLTLHSSLQHECLHGHPFRNQTVNDALVWPPIGLFIPYTRFKSCHLKHHVNINITDPYDDPESYYLERRRFEALHPLMQRLLTINNTLVGRVTIGPALSTIGFARLEWRLIRQGRSDIALTWLIHIAAITALLTILNRYANIHGLAYLTSAYFGMGLLMVRSFLEHQASEQAGARSVIIESRGPLSFLFLNNNLHFIHHAYPSLAWYRLPGFFQKNRDRFLKMNKGYRYSNYLEVFRHYAFKPKEPVAHPLERRTSKLPDMSGHSKS